MDEQKMNLYEKIAVMRVELQNQNIKKTGENRFAGYKYYELSDILPPINELERKHKVVSYVTFHDDCAALTLTNAENPEEHIHIYSPASEASLKGAHPIQNLGACETYQRRYLYMAAYNIVESDILDATQGDEKKVEKKSSTSKKTTRENAEDSPELAATKKAIIELCKKKISDGVKKEAVYAVIENHNNGNKNPNSITDVDVGKMIIDKINAMETE